MRRGVGEAREKVRIGFIGAGSMGQCAHLRNYLTFDDCRVTALAEPRPRLGREVQARYGIEHLYRDHRQLLAAEAGRLDAIVAIQPYHHHARLIPEILAAKVPVLIEKPLARSTSAAGAIMDALRGSASRLFVGYHKRSDPATIFAVREIRSLQQSGELGALHYVRMTMPPGSWDVSGFSTLIRTNETVPAVEPDAPPANMDADAARKLDIFVNYYIHQVNLIRHLLGENYTVSYADPAGVLLVGHGVGNGVTVALEMQPYRSTRDWHEVALVTFEKGYVRLELPAPLAIDRPGRVTLFKDAGGADPVTIRPTLPWVHAMRQQARHFIDAARGETTPLCTADEALEDLRVAERYIDLLLRA